MKKSKWKSEIIIDPFDWALPALIKYDAIFEEIRYQFLFIQLNCWKVN